MLNFLVSDATWENLEIFFVQKVENLYFHIDNYQSVFLLSQTCFGSGQTSNMAHDKNYFPEKKPVLLHVIKIQKGSWEYSKIICERMKVITILI